jgi:hypothetical protein
VHLKRPILTTKKEKKQQEEHLSVPYLPPLEEKGNEKKPII